MKCTKTLTFLFAVVAACWAIGCSSDPKEEADAAPDASGDADMDETPIPDASGDADEDTETEPVDPCLDSDGDGYGVNCELGLDCDDDNADVNCADACGRRHAGCPCDDEGRVEVCRTFGPLDTIDGEGLCYAGTRTCTDGQWGPCGEMSPYAFDSDAEASGSGSGVRRQPVLGRAEPCSGSSCDISCTFVHDCISAPDLREATNLVYDVRGSPAAVILRDTEENGIFLRTIENYCDTDEQVTWWAMDFDLRSEAPQAVALRVRTAVNEAALFSADWTRVVLCPEGPCTRPEHTNDRDYGQGNLHDALQGDAVHHPWIEIEVSLTSGGAEESPRYIGHWLYYYCDSAD